MVQVILGDRAERTHENEIFRPEDKEEITKILENLSEMMSETFQDIDSLYI
jgi:hypothetical protein